METKTVFVPVPVEEFEPRDGWIDVVLARCKFPRIHSFFPKSKEECGDIFIKAFVSHVLVEKEMVVLAPEELEDKMVGFAEWTSKKGWNYLYRRKKWMNSAGFYKTTKELLDIYLKELKEKV